MGLRSASKKTSGISGSVEAFKAQLSEESANPSDFGQLLAAPKTKCASVLPAKQHPFDLDADQRLMA
jgi:hypothetical protein